MGTTGLFKPFCIHGHIRTLETVDKKGSCKECKREERNSPHGKARSKRNAARRLSKPEARIHAKEYARYYNFKKYGLTPEEYEALLVKQSYSCAICKIHQQDLKRALAIDHDHKTNKVRGLLCTICNTRVVFVVEEYSHVIDAAKSYLGGL